MGWKSTVKIKRSKAMRLAIERLVKCSDDELSNALEALGFGDDKDLPLYGYNFEIVDDDTNDEVFEIEN